MKFKSILAAFLISFFLIGSANATPFTIDLEAINSIEGTNLANYQGTTGFSTIDVDSSLGVTTEGSQYTTIDQSFGDDGILNNGDTFTEFGFLGILDYDGSGNINIVDNKGTSDNSDDVSYKMYIEFNNLTGYIDNYSNPDGQDTKADANFADNIQDDAYDIFFDNTVGSGKIEIFLEDQGGSNEITLATLDVLAGEGDSPDLVLDSSEGQFDLLMDFTTFNDVSNDVWSLNGMTFEEWEVLYPNSITMDTENLGATVKTPPTSYNGGTVDDLTDDGFKVDVLNDGKLGVNAVPEPTTLLLFGTGLLGLAAFGRKKLMRRS